MITTSSLPIHRLSSFAFNVHHLAFTMDRWTVSYKRSARKLSITKTRSLSLFFFLFLESHMTTATDLFFALFLSDV
jgi:hypothetical protein